MVDSDDFRFRRHWIGGLGDGKVFGFVIHNEVGFLEKGAAQRVLSGIRGSAYREIIRSIVEEGLRGLKVKSGIWKSDVKDFIWCGA